VLAGSSCADDCLVTRNLLLLAIPFAVAGERTSGFLHAGTESLRVPDASAIVRVDADGCPSKPRRGSGFAWTASGVIVTSLHVVAGCTNLRVRYPVAGGQLRVAQLVRVLRAHDLALLSVQQAPNVTPLIAAPTEPGAGAVMRAWGYPVAVRGLIDTRLERRHSSGTLNDLVNSEVRQRLLAVGIPSLSSRVLFLEGGHLLPGHSGGPLVDAFDRVVGIANGGLEQGAIEVSWAIPATALQQLASSTETSPAINSAIDDLFSGDLVEPSDIQTFSVDMSASASIMAQIAPTATSFSCGTATFVRVRTRTFAELAPWADDPVGLARLVAGAGGLSLASDAYDIYQDIRTGATLVTPEGSSPRTNMGFCVMDVYGTGSDPVVQQVFRTDQAQSIASGNIVSAQFDAALKAVFGSGWMTDTHWSYTAPKYRPDSAIVTRQAYAQFNPSAFGAAPLRYMFESLSLKRGYFLGVAAMRHYRTPYEAAQEQGCLATPVQACLEPLRRLRRSLQATIGAHLSSFPLR
jgi:hypothetical protein